MDKNKYLNKISEKIKFIARHWRIGLFLFFIVFLFYVLMLGIRITTEINISPNPEDVNKRFITVKIRKDIINSIENFSLFKEKYRNEKLDNFSDKNPFLPYSSESAAVSPEPAITPSPSTAPATP